MDKKKAEKLGHRLKMLRMNRKFKQKVLAQKLKVTQAYVSDLEAGKKMIPTETLLEIAKIFNVRLDYFDLNTTSPLDLPEQISSNYPNVLEKLAAMEERLARIEVKLQNV